MRPIRVEHSTHTYTAPSCQELPATVADYGDGTKGVETVWELTEEERAEVARTGRIYLLIRGTVVPPVSMSVTDMVEQRGPET